jgi:hypothetical protein
VGDTDGYDVVGDSVGDSVGIRDGSLVVGDNVGDNVGVDVDGADVGLLVVGASVGDPVNRQQWHGHNVATSTSLHKSESTALAHVSCSSSGLQFESHDGDPVGLVVGD